MWIHSETQTKELNKLNKEILFLFSLLSSFYYIILIGETYKIRIFL
jgi:hypothetical protein